MTGQPQLKPSQVKKRMNQARGTATRRSYAGHWARWTDWAIGKRINPKPAAPAFIAAWLTERAATGASISTIKTIRSAISAIHLEDGMPDPTAHRLVKQAVAALSQKYSRPQRKVRGLTQECLAAIQATASFPRVLPSGRLESIRHAEIRARTDVALVSVMRDGLLNSSEAATITWGDVERADDGSGNLNVPGEGTVQYLSRGTIAVLATIRPASPRLETLVFGLSARQICRRICAAADSAGLGGDFAGLSPRVGMAMDLAGVESQLSDLITDRYHSLAAD